jgi:hypothetical protein
MRKPLRFSVLVGAVVLVASGCSFITRVTVASDGTQANVASTGCCRPVLSENGRYALFTSGASNLVPGDTNGRLDVFRHDTVTGATVRASLGPGNAQISFPFDSSAVGISADGQTVAFQTAAQLLPADTSNVRDVYLRDMNTGAITLATILPDGKQLSDPHSVGETALSRNGRYLAFYDVDDTGPGVATSQIEVRDLVAGTTTALGVPGLRFNLAISGDGKHVLDEALCEASCPTLDRHVHVYDWKGVTYPFAPTGTLTSADVSDDGSRVLHHGASGLAEFNRRTGTDQPVGCCSTGQSPAMSADGRVVVFSSSRSDLVPNDTNGVSDWFALDLASGAIRRISVSATGAQGNGADTDQDQQSATVDGTGRYAAFSSLASNLVPNDTDGFADGFVADAARPAPTMATPSSVARGAQHVTVRIDGGFLLDDASYDLGPGITVESVTHLANGSQRLTVSVAADASTGSRDVTVSLPGVTGAATGTCGSCLHVS